LRLLYLGNWALNDGLTQATVLPHIRLLLHAEKLQHLVFVTIERNGQVPQTPSYLVSDKISYEPLVSRNMNLNIFNRILDLKDFRSQIKLLIKKYNIEKVIARGSPAGGLIYSICAKNNIPLYVESFEPHADYMKESGVWGQFDPRFLLEKKWESALKKKATGLIPVAERYKQQLIKEGVKGEKIAVVPCSVNLEKFNYKEDDRIRIRKMLNIPEDAFVGVYVGKFGGYYFNDEAFLLYKKIMDVSDTWILIVSPDPPEQILQKIKEFDLQAERIKITSANHDEVSSYLSAADFGFATIKPSQSKNFLSLIKIGEYWACGLPVIITENVGDDSDFIEEQGIGVKLKNGWKDQSPSFYLNMVAELKEIKDKPRIRSIAEQRRSLNNVVKAYEYFDLL
jgi:glycosyltransferase involved in cell wall biosynthesis